MTSATINGNTYTDDASSTTGLAAGGHRLRFVPALADVVAVAAQVANNAAVASAAAASAVTGATTSATSTTSLTIGLGAQSLTIQTGKNIVVGMTIKVAVTADGTKWMAGDVTSYNSGSGALAFNSVVSQGSGTASAWTVSLSGPPGMGVPASAGNTNRFLTNNGTAPNWSAVLTEVSGRIGIGASASFYKLEIRDDVNGYSGVGVSNFSTGSSAFSHLRCSSNAGTAYFQISSVAAGSFGRFGTSGASGGFYIGTDDAAVLALYTNNTVRVTLSAAGVLDIGAGWTIASHPVRFESAAIAPLTGAIAYSSIAHGGSRRPDNIMLVGRCKLTTNGIAVGEEVGLGNIRANATTTLITLRQSGTPTYLYGAGQAAALAATNFDIVVKAIWL